MGVTTKQTLCCLLHSVTQLLALYIYSSCSCHCQHNRYSLYNRCTRSSYPSFITIILQAHLGACWLPNCTKILCRELVKTVSIPAQERKVQCTISQLHVYCVHSMKFKQCFSTSLWKTLKSNVDN